MALLGFLQRERRKNSDVFFEFFPISIISDIACNFQPVRRILSNRCIWRRVFHIFRQGKRKKVEKYHTTTSEDLDRICMAVNGIERPRVTG